MYGSGANLIWDPAILEFAGFTQSDLPADEQSAASPIGFYEQPGQYTGFGIGTFEFFNGMTSAGLFGEFVFNVIGEAPSDFQGCGGNDATPGYGYNGLICITPNAMNPFVSLAGDVVTENIFVGFGAYIPPAEPLPLPGALWLLLSGVGALYSLKKT